MPQPGLHWYKTRTTYDSEGRPIPDATLTQAWYGATVGPYWYVLTEEELSGPTIEDATDEQVEAVGIDPMRSISGV